MSKYDQLPQWIQSQNGSDFCPLNDVAEEVRSQLRQEDKYTITIHGFRYTVKDYEGKWLVFRRSVSANTVRKTTTTQTPRHTAKVSNVHEIKIMSLNEANECIRSENPEYNVFGSDPVKIINNEPCVVMAKYAQPTTGVQAKS